MITIFYIAILVWAAANLLASFTDKGRKAMLSQLYLNPLIVAGAIQGATGLVGLLRRPPKPPDVFTPALRQATRARNRVFETLGEQSENLEAQPRARGATGSGGSADREALIRASSSTVADIDASLADLITQAGNQQRQLEFQDRSQRFASSQQALASLGNAATSIFTLSQLQGSGATGDFQANPTPQLSFVPSGPTPATELNPLEVGIRGGRSLPSLAPTVDPNTGRIVFGG